MGLCGPLLKAAVGSVMAEGGEVLQVAWGALDASFYHAAYRVATRGGAVSPRAPAWGRHLPRSVPT